jgi:broad specificity phosphatase PhoE
MGMPLDLVFIRHGQSEANMIHDLERKSTIHDNHTDVYDRPDWMQRLSELGVEQAVAAGEWLRKNFIDPTEFDRCYGSTFLRTRETALYVGGESCDWHLDDRLKERDWGLYGATPREKREALFPNTHKNHSINKWYARMDGGESLADNVLMRARDFCGSLHRDMDKRRVLVVSHGEFILTMRYLLERMMPEEWMEMEGDVAQDIKNCTILHYSRQNPDDPSDVRPHISWMRMIYPYSEADSPFGGTWRQVIEKRVVKGDELRKQIDYAKPLIDRSVKR